MSVPNDDMIVLAALLAGSEWRAAEDIASTLRRLGFKITPQAMVGALQRLLREESPMFERSLREWERLYVYRVTQFGRTQLGNRFPMARALWRS